MKSDFLSKEKNYYKCVKNKGMEFDLSCFQKKSDFCPNSDRGVSYLKPGTFWAHTDIPFGAGVTLGIGENLKVK